MKTLQFLLASLSIWTISEQTVDLNLRQLQFVSDHLTTKECRRLITALYQKDFQLKPKQLRPIQDNEPCLLHLVDWNKQTGEDATVEDLCLRLHQIGRVDIARELAKAVYDETAVKIHKFFLDDPFKKTAHPPGARIMEEDEEEEDKKKVEVAVDNERQAPDDRRFRLAIVALTLTLTFFLGTVMFVYCPASLHTVCPRVCIATYEAMSDSVKETASTLRTLTATEALGMNKENVRRPRYPDANSATREEQDRLVHSILDI